MEQSKRSDFPKRLFLTVLLLAPTAYLGLILRILIHALSDRLMPNRCGTLIEFGYVGGDLFVGELAFCVCSAYAVGAVVSGVTLFGLAFLLRKRGFLCPSLVLLGLILTLEGAYAAYWQETDLYRSVLGLVMFRALSVLFRLGTIPVVGTILFRGIEPWLAGLGRPVAGWRRIASLALLGGIAVAATLGTHWPVWHLPTYGVMNVLPPALFAGTAVILCFWPPRRPSVQVKLGSFLGPLWKAWLLAVLGGVLMSLVIVVGIELN